MPMILHGSPSSICTRRILGIISQAGLTDEVKLNIITDWSMLKTEDWLKNHNPFGQLPYLEDTDNMIEVFESRAIAKYICLKAESPLMPTTSDPITFAKFETACSFEFADFEAFATRITYELISKKGKGEALKADVLTMAERALTHRLGGYERILVKTKFLAGDQLTVVDMFHLPFGEAMLQTNSAPALVDGSLPNVARWWKEISSLDGWKKVKEEVWGESLPAWG